MPGNAFVYGTLLADEVVSLLIQRVPQTKPATLKGFSRHSVKRKVYPAIVPSENSVVHGKVSVETKLKFCQCHHPQLVLSVPRLAFWCAGLVSCDANGTLILQVLLNLSDKELDILDGEEVLLRHVPCLADGHQQQHLCAAVAGIRHLASSIVLCTY